MDRPHTAFRSSTSGRWVRLTTLLLFTALTALLSFTSLFAGCESVSAQSYQEIAEGFAERTQFNGVILIAQRDTVLYAEAHGYENAEDRVPTRLDTRYQLGSISKWITSLVVLKLADQGTLSLTAPIQTYLPDYRSDTGRHLTLHHLITHTSGVPNDIITAYQEDPAILNEPLTTMEAVRRYASGDLLFEPGSQFDYSHSNWILVKAIIEQATGSTFEENVRALIVRPVGLEDTGVFWDGSPAARLAPGYEDLRPTPVRAELPFPAYLACAGGVYSTAPDLLALLNALYEGRSLSDDALEKLDTVYWRDGDLSYGSHAGGYAYGGRVRVMELGSDAQRVLWQTGSNGPSKSRVTRVLDNGLTIIALTNAGTSPEETGALSERVLRAFYR